MRERSLKEYLFYGRGQDGTMSYSTARGRFMHYIEKRGWIIGATRSTRFAIPLPQSFSMPGCGWSACRCS